MRNVIYQLHKVLSFMLLSRLTSYVDAVTADPKCGFRRDPPHTDQTFCNHHMYSRKIGGVANGTVHRAFMDFNKAYDLVRTEVLYNILNELSTSMKTITLPVNKMPLRLAWFPQQIIN
jgi:hypothetical protein